MLISEAFEKTADTLDRVGWHKRGYSREGGLSRLVRKRETATKDNCHVSALGAAMLAGNGVFNVVDGGPARALFTDLFRRGIAQYNDTAKDKRQVVRALRKASKKAKAQGI